MSIRSFAEEFALWTTVVIHGWLICKAFIFLFRHAPNFLFDRIFQRRGVVTAILSAGLHTSFWCGVLGIILGFLGIFWNELLGLFWWLQGIAIAIALTGIAFGAVADLVAQHSNRSAPPAEL